MRASKVRPGTYIARLGTLEWRAFVFEDVETSVLLVRFDGIDRGQRMDEIPTGVQWQGCRSAVAV